MEPTGSMNSMGDWVYFVTLDGDYAGRYDSAEEAEYARLNEGGHIKSLDRVVWRERTVIEDVYPVRLCEPNALDEQFSPLLDALNDMTIRKVRE